MNKFFRACAIVAFIGCNASFAAAQNPFSQSSGNPFATAQADRYAGVFKSDAIRLRLIREGDGYVGELYYAATSQTYPVRAALVDDKINGVFTSGGEEFSFTFELGPDGKSGKFETEGFSGTLVAAGAAPQSALLSGDVIAIFDEALSIAQSASGPARSSALASVAGNLARAGDIARAQEIADSIPAGDSMREIALSTVGQGQAQHSDFEGARKTASSLLGEVPRNLVFRTIAESQAKFGDVNAAKATARSMVAAEQVIALIAIAKVQMEAGDQAGAIQTVDEAWLVVPVEQEVRVRNRRRKGPTSSSAMAGRIHVRTIAAAYGSVGAAERGLEKISLLADIPSIVASLSGIAKGQAKLGDMAGFANTIATAESHAKKAMEALRFYPYNDIAQAYAVAGDMEGVRRSANSVSEDFREGVYVAVFYELTGKKDLANARLIAREIKNPAYQASIASALVYAQAQTGDFDGALAAARNMADASSRASTISFTASEMALQRR